MESPLVNLPDGGSADSKHFRILPPTFGSLRELPYFPSPPPLPVNPRKERPYKHIKCSLDFMSINSCT